MGTLALLGLLLLIVSYGVWQYRKLLKWKRELEAWQERRDEALEEQAVTIKFFTAWNRDLNRREIAWQEFKDKVERDLKWNWKI